MVVGEGVHLGSVAELRGTEEALAVEMEAGMGGVRAVAVEAVARAVAAAVVDAMA